MCGKIYLEIAKNCLDNWYADMPEEEKSALLKRADFDELESYIGARESIEAAIRGFNDGCRMACLPDYFYLMPEEFMEEAIISDQVSARWQKHLDEISYSVLFKDQYYLCKAVVFALDRIHNTWVKNNVSKFFDENRKEKRFMFMPLPVIGWKEARKDLLFLMPILEAVGFNLKEEWIEETYKMMVKKFEHDELVDFIVELGDTYDSLDDSIKEQVKNRKVAEQIATQCQKAA